MGLLSGGAGAGGHLSISFFLKWTKKDKNFLVSFDDFVYICGELCPNGGVFYWLEAH